MASMTAHRHQCLSTRRRNVKKLLRSKNNQLRLTIPTYGDGHSGGKLRGQIAIAARKSSIAVLSPQAQRGRRRMTAETDVTPNSYRWASSGTPNASRRSTFSPRRWELCKCRCLNLDRSVPSEERPADDHDAAPANARQLVGPEALSESIVSGQTKPYRNVQKKGLRDSIHSDSQVVCSHPPLAPRQEGADRVPVRISTRCRVSSPKYSQCRGPADDNGFRSERSNSDP